MIEYITALFNLSVTTCQISAIWKSSLIIPIPNPVKDTSLETSYQSISLLCPAAKVLKSVILPAINKYLNPVPNQHGFRPDHSTTLALLQLTTYIAMGFNLKKSTDRTVCVAVDLDTWLSCYLRGRQANTCFRGVKSAARKVNTGEPQGSKLSPFSFYIADVPRPTEPVKRVCCTDGISVWATGVKIPDLEDGLNKYLEEITAYPKDNSLLISAPKSSVTLFSLDIHPPMTHPRILIDDSQLPLVQYPKILGVYLDASLSFNMRIAAT